MQFILGVYSQYTEIMRRNKKTSIKYRSGYYQDKTAGIERPKFKTKQVITSNVKRYNNSLHVLSKLDKCSYLFILYLTEEMDSSNTVHITKLVRNRFADFMRLNCGIKYQDGTIKKSVGTLKKNGLLLSYGGEIDYTVSPLYFFNGSDNERKKLIAKLLFEAYRYPDSNLKQALSF